MRRWVRYVASLGALVAATRLRAQSVVVVPDRFAVPAGSSIGATVQWSPRLPLERWVLDRARVIGSAGATPLTRIVADRAALRFRYTAPRSGQYMFAVSLKPRSGQVTQSALIHWLRAERADSEAARLDREPAFRPTDTVTYRSTRYATTIVDVGSGPRVFDRAAGFAIDIVPMQDPAEATEGDMLVFRFETGGDPISRLLVRLQPITPPGWRSSLGGSARTNEREFVTDHDGAVLVPVPRAGMWGLSTVRVVLLASPGPTGPEPGYWDVSWSAYVMHVKARPLLKLP